MAANNQFKDKFSIKKIGTGRLFSSGSMTASKTIGLAKALRSSKIAGRSTYTKNLSKQDLQTFQKLIGDELKNLSANSQGLSLKAQRRIMAKGEALRLAGKISNADKQDLRNIVGSLGKQSTNKTVQPEKPSSAPVQRAVHFITDKKEGVSSKDNIIFQNEGTRSFSGQDGFARQPLNINFRPNLLNNFPNPDKSLLQPEKFENKNAASRKNKTPNSKNNPGKIDINADKLVELDIG